VSDLYTTLADLYDTVFDWDIESEADWIVERLGAGCRTVLEPGCGSGRMFAALERRGLAVTGIDLSPAMVARARARGTDATVVLADMAGFDFGAFDLGAFDGAVCPINTLGHLSRPELASHLDAMSRALAPGASYLVQLAVGAPVGEASRWEVERDGQHVRGLWSVESRDANAGVEWHRSLFEVLAGPRAGEVHEQVHAMSFWTAETWGAVVDASPLEWKAVYDGASPARPRVAFTATGGLLWHELLRP
jgi:SAM-dependent methyltransferase